MGIPISALPLTTERESDDLIPMVKNIGVAGGTRRITVPDFLKYGSKVLFVDATSGSDAQGTRGSLLAYATLTAAKDAAQDGDTIVVLPGDYTENNLLKNGVNWHFMAGAVVTYTNTEVTGSTTVYGIFDDRDAPCTCKITGDGEFSFLAGHTMVASNQTIKGCVYISNALSEISLTGTVKIQAHIADNLIYGVRIEDTVISHIHVKEIVDVGFGLTQSGLPSTACGVLFKWGLAFITADRIKAGLHAVHASQKTSPTGTAQLHLYAGQIEGDPLASGSLNNIWIEGGTTDDFKIFVEADFGIPGESDFCVIQGGGEHSVRIKRMTTAAQSAIFNVLADNTGVYSPKATLFGGQMLTGEYALLCGANGVGDPQVTLIIENLETTGHFIGMYFGEVIVTGGIWRKFAANTLHSVSRASDGSGVSTIVTSTPHGLSNGSLIATSGFGNVLYNVIEEAVTVVNATTFQYATPMGIEVTTADTGGIISVGGSGGFGVNHTGGTLRLQGVTIDTSDFPGLDNYAVQASASGLILDGCKMISPPSSAGIGGTATVKVYGQSFSNPAKAGTITVTVGTLTNSTLVT